MYALFRDDLLARRQLCRRKDADTAQLSLDARHASVGAWRDLLAAHCTTSSTFLESFVRECTGSLVGIMLSLAQNVSD